MIGSFRNERRLFEQVSNKKSFGLFVTGAPHEDVSFIQIVNLFHPKTIDESLAHDGHGPVPGIKNGDDEWDLRGHRARAVKTSNETLELFAQLFDDPGTPPLEARLPLVDSSEILNVLRAFARQPKLGHVGERWGTTREWNEGDRTADGTIVQRTEEAQTVDELIVSGPQFFLGNPVYKTPNAPCRNNKDYTLVVSV